jgi:hypothetical protein
MRFTRSSLVRTLTTVVVSGCVGGTGSGLTGIAAGTGGTPRTLSFTVQPSNGTAGEILTPAIQVTARDSVGNTDVSFVGSVTIGLSANPTGAFLNGAKTVTAAFGVASFGDLAVDRVGSGYTLRATASAATATTSSGFSIAAQQP